LDPDQVRLVGWGPEQATEFEREQIDRLGIEPVDVEAADTPLSENWGRNEGLPYDTFLTALRTLLAAPALSAVTVTALNPHHTEPGAEAIERLVAALAVGLTDRPG